MQSWLYSDEFYFEFLAILFRRKTGSKMYNSSAGNPFLGLSSAQFSTVEFYTEYLYSPFRQGVYIFNSNNIPFPAAWPPPPRPPPGVRRMRLRTRLPAPPCRSRATSTARAKRPPSSPSGRRRCRKWIPEISEEKEQIVAGAVKVSEGRTIKWCCCCCCCCS